MDTEPTWFASYLSGRTQTVSSELGNITRGVTQGDQFYFLYILMIYHRPLSCSPSSLPMTQPFLPVIKIWSIWCKRSTKSSKKIKEYFRAKKMLLHEKKTQFMLFLLNFQQCKCGYFRQQQQYKC